MCSPWKLLFSKLGNSVTVWTESANLQTIGCDCDRTFFFFF